MVALLVANESMVLPSPSSSTETMMRPGAIVPAELAARPDHDVERLLRGVAGRIGRIADDQDLYGIDADRIRAGAARGIAIVVGDDGAAGRAGDAQIDAAGRARARAGRTGHVRLIPLDHDGEEIARRNGRNGHRQRGGVGRSGGVEVQQVARPHGAAARRVAKLGAVFS